MAKKKDEALLTDEIEEQEVPSVNEDILEEYIDYDVPPARVGEEQQMYVALQGFGRLIPRGQTVTLPRKVVIFLKQKFMLEQKYERDVAKTYEQDEATRRALG